MQPFVGIQLYTVRNLIDVEGFAPIVKQIAEIGYAGIEPAGFPGTTPEAAAKLFRDLGLQVSSGHFPMPLGDESARVIDAAQAIGTRRLVSGRGPDDFKTPDLIKQTCELFNQAAAVAARHQMTFAIHNHWWEFETLNGQPVYELMLQHLDPAVEFEIDVYWVKTAGADPAEVIRKIGKRAPLLHIKDGPCIKEQPMTAVGDGTVDFAAIAKASQPTAQWWLVELDECATDMMEAVRRSYKFLTDKKFVRLN